MSRYNMPITDKQSQEDIQYRKIRYLPHEDDSDGCKQYKEIWKDTRSQTSSDDGISTSDIDEVEEKVDIEEEIEGMSDKEIEAKMQDPLSLLCDDPEYDELIDLTNAIKEHKHHNNYNVMCDEDVKTLKHNMKQYHVKMNLIQFVLIIITDTVNALLPPELWDVDTLTEKLEKYKPIFENVARSSKPYKKYVHAIETFEKILPKDIYLLDIQHLVAKHRNKEAMEDTGEIQYEPVHHEEEPVDQAKANYEWENHYLLQHFLQSDEAEEYKHEANNIHDHIIHDAHYHIFTDAGLASFNESCKHLHVSHDLLNAMFIRIGYKIGVFLHMHSWDILAIRRDLHHVSNKPPTNMPYYMQDIKNMHLLFDHVEIQSLV